MADAYPADRAADGLAQLPLSVVQATRLRRNGDLFWLRAFANGPQGLSTDSR